jgi:DNA-binding HxlR family transcriptional regulator
MQRKSFAEMQCPIARGLERVGEWWSILILRDAFRGKRRFDEFRQSLGVAPNMLTRRLNALVEAGLLRRELYCQHPPRHGYRLTERGKDFRPVLLALLAWGNRHFFPEGESVVLLDSDSGAPVDPVLVDRNTGRPLEPGSYVLAPGPAAKAAPGSRQGARQGARQGRGTERPPRPSVGGRPPPRQRPTTGHKPGHKRG